MNAANKIKELIAQMRGALETDIWFGGLLPVLVCGLRTMLTDIEMLVGVLEGWGLEKDRKIRELRDEVAEAERRASNAERSLPPFIPPTVKEMGYPLSMWFMRYALLSASEDKKPKEAKMLAIKYARIYYGLGLADAKNMVEAMPHVPYMQQLVTWWFTNSALTPGPCRNADGSESSDRFGMHDDFRTPYTRYLEMYGKGESTPLSPSEFLAVMFELDRGETVGPAGLCMPNSFVRVHGDALKGCLSTRPINISALDGVQ